MKTKWVFEVPMARATEIALTLGVFTGSVFPAGTAHKCGWAAKNRFVAMKVAEALVAIDVEFRLKMEEG